MASFLHNAIASKLTPTDAEHHAIPEGAHEHREAAMASFLTHRHRGLAVLVRSYRY